MKKEFEPYYVVIFSSIRTEVDDGYEEMNQLTYDLVEKEEGYLGSESYLDADGRRVTIIRFRDHDDILRWKANKIHSEAQKKGIESWYKFYNIKVCKVEREYEFHKN